MKKYKLNYEELKAFHAIKKYARKKSIYAYVTHVSASGMSRDIKFYVIHKKRLISLTHFIKIALKLRYGKDYGVRVYGCGMDMIFNTLYNLNSIALYHNMIKPSKKHTKHDLYYNGIVNTYYNYL